MVVMAALVAGVLPASAAPAERSVQRCGGSVQAAPQGRWIREALDRSNDVDWFRIQVPASAAGELVHVILGGLPANYRLDVFAGCDERLDSSNRSGRRYEEVLLAAPEGPLWVRVRRGADGASSPKRYALRIAHYPSGVQQMTQLVDKSNRSLRVTGEVINTLPASRENVVVRVLHEVRPPGADRAFLVDRVVIDRLAPGQSKAFKVTRRLPRHHHRSVVRVSAGEAATAPVAPLAVVGAKGRTKSGRTVFSGEVVNRTDDVVDRPIVRLVRYDGRARPVEAEYLRMGEPMAPGERRTFAFDIPAMRGTQRSILAAEGLASLE